MNYSNYIKITIFIIIFTTFGHTNEPNIKNGFMKNIIADYKLNKDGFDSTNISGEMTLTGTKFQKNALYINGIYQYNKNKKGYKVVTPRLYIDYSALSFSFSFNPIDFGGHGTRRKTVLIAGGGGYRWLVIEKSLNKDDIIVSFNNKRQIYTFKNVELKEREWHRLIFSFDNVKKNFLLILDGTILGEKFLPNNFKFEVVGSSSEQRDKKLMFVDYANANTFHGYIKELVISNRPLDKSKLDKYWRLFSAPTTYSSKNYSLRKDISYFELRKYLFDQKTDKQVTNKYIPYFKIYRKELSSYPKKLVSNFQKIPFNNKRVTNIFTEKLNSPVYKFKVRGFIIKNNNKFWSINEEKDIIWLFDKIDTEAELYHLLKMKKVIDSNTIKSSYKKTSIGYDVKIIRRENKIDNIYIYHIKTDGEFSKEFISSSRRGKKPIVFEDKLQIDIEEILNNEDFITP